MSGAVRYALAGGLAVVAYLMAPAGGGVQAAVFLGILGVSSGLLARAVGRLPAERRGPWWVLVAGVAVYAVTTAGWYLLPVGWGTTVAYPSALDAGFFVSYALVAAALVLVCRGVGRSDVGGVMIDALVAAAAVGAVVQAFVMEPVLDAGASSGPASSGLAGAVSIAYPVAGVVLGAFALQLLFRGVLSPLAGWLLVTWIGGGLAGDVWYARASLDGSFRYGHPMFAAWLVSSVALGALALHPSFGEVSAEARRAPDPRRRLLALGAAAAVALGALVADTGTDTGPGHGWRHGSQVAWVAVIVGLILLRIRGLLSDVAPERGLRDDIERLAADLAHASSHDPLTGLANRSVFHDALRCSLSGSRPPGRAPALVVVDLGAFKAVNDTYGHPVGDGMLRVVAQRLRSFADQASVVARLSGNEFALVLHDAEVAEATALAEAVVSSLALPVVLAEAVIVPVVRVGVHVPAPWETDRDVALRADAALYAAKAASRGIELFDAERHRRFIERYQIELQVRSAAANGELVLHYQPVIDLATRRIVGAEALVRWHHPTRGLLGPVAFIEIAEESGAIVELGRWVLRQACADAQSWRERVAGAGEVGVAVNVSRRQLGYPAIVDDVRDALTASGLPAAALTVEVTETALMTDNADMVRLLEQFSALGVELAMDDFGTGYSSLAQLRTLPIDVLKIDKAFVDGIASEEEEWALAAAIVRLAGSLGKRTLAEGVERPSQLAHLRALGCELAQGYLFSRPVPLADFERLLEQSPGPAAQNAAPSRSSPSAVPAPND